MKRNITHEVEIKRVRRSTKIKRFSVWVGNLFLWYDTKIGFGGVQRVGWILDEQVPIMWQPDVARWVTVVRSYCGLVSLQEPIVAALSFSRFLLLQYKREEIETSGNLDSKTGREKSIHGNGLTMGVAEGGASSSHADKQGVGGEEALAGGEGCTIVEGDDGGKSKSTYRSYGTHQQEGASNENDDRAESGTSLAGDTGARMNDSRSQRQDDKIPSGDGEMSPTHINQKGFDPNDDGAHIGPGSGSAQRKETQMWSSQDSDKRDEFDTKRRRLSGMERG